MTLKYWIDRFLLQRCQKNGATTVLKSWYKKYFLSWKIRLFMDSWYRLDAISIDCFRDAKSNFNSILIITKKCNHHLFLDWRRSNYFELGSPSFRFGSPSSFICQCDRMWNLSSEPCVWWGYFRCWQYCGKNLHSFLSKTSELRNFRLKIKSNSSGPTSCRVTSDFRSMKSNDEFVFLSENSDLKNLKEGVNLRKKQGK